MIIFGHDFLQQLDGFLAGRSAEDIVMVAKAGDVAFLFLGRGQSVVSRYQTISFGILACDDSCSSKEADNGLFFVGAAGSLVCAGLSNDFFNWETTVDYFGNAEDMMCAGVGLVYSFRLDWSFCHWKTKGLARSWSACAAMTMSRLILLLKRLM